MNKLFQTLLIIPLCTTLVSAQTPEIEKEIMAYVKSTPKLISNGRMYLFDSYINSDMAKVQEIRSYLMSVNDSSYLILRPKENRLIMYRTNEFRELLEDIINPNTRYGNDVMPKIEPPQDDLLDELLYSCNFYKPLIKVQINNSTLSDEEKSFLVLYFNYITIKKADRNQKKFNYESDKFLSQWPNSRFETLIREDIRYVEELGNWGSGVDFFMGVNSFSGKLGEQILNGFAIGNGFDVSYKRVDFYLRNHLAFHETKQLDNYVTNTYKVRGSVNFIMPEISMGIPVFENHRIKLSPFAGIAAMGINETTYDTPVDRINLDMTRTYIGGINLNLKLNTSKDDKVHKGSKYVMLRLRYTYAAPQFHKNHPEYSGVLHSVQLSLGAKSRGMKRVI